jgi:Protein of unknown function (DUF3037)
MERKSGKYALIQFCPVPERMEFLNIGVLLVVPEIKYVGIKIIASNARIDRIFGIQPNFYIDAVKKSFEYRLRSEFSNSFDQEEMELFSKKRANDIRLSPIMPIIVDDCEAVLSKLFLELVGRDENVPRQPRIQRQLKDAFAKFGVEHYLDRPSEIELPEYGLKIKAPYGYQNGCYNLVDGMRLPDNISDGLGAVGKKAMQGNLLWKHFSGQGENCKRLNIVGDFAKQSNEFYHAVEDQMKDANVKLYRLDNLRPLLSDIELNASLHSA